MIDEGFKFCPVCINMIKTLLKKLSQSLSEIINNIKILKQLHAEFPLIGRITKEIFNKMSIPPDTNTRGKIINLLKYSLRIPKQRAQVLSTELCVDNIKKQKEIIKNKKIIAYQNVHDEIASYVKTCDEASKNSR